MSSQSIVGSNAALATWRCVWGTIRFQPVRYGLCNAIRIAERLTALVPGLVAREFFNLISAPEQAHFSLWTLIAILLASAVARAGTIWGRVRLDVSFAHHTRSLLHKNTMRHILGRPGAFPLPEPPGEAISRFREDADEVGKAALWLSDFFAQLVYASLAVLIMLSINVPVTILAILFPLLMVGVTKTAASRVERYRQATRKAASTVTSFIAEIFGAAEAIKNANAMGRVSGHFSGLNAARREAALKDRLFDELLNTVSMHSVDLGVAVVLLVAPPLLESGSMTIGDLTLFVYYLRIVTQFAGFAGSFWARYRQVGVSIDRLAHMLDGAPAAALIEPGPVYLRGELPEVAYVSKTAADRLEEVGAAGLSFRYPGSRRGIEGVDLQLRRGSFTVVTGRVGSGKTTLLRVLLGLLPRDAGMICWNKQPVVDPAASFVPPRCAYTPQVPRLFSTTLRENILLGMPEEQADLASAVQLGVLEQDIAALEHGLDMQVGQRGMRLSGGQAQRSAAVRMFVRRAELLVFDDLSSALDVETEDKLWERLFAQTETSGDAAADDRPTCLAVSHRRAALQLADHIIVLKDGKVIAEGRLGELLETCEEMQYLWAGNLDKAVALEEGSLGQTVAMAKQPAG
jgi:ATP-binding cassette, subfamily B, bacterial